MLKILKGNFRAVLRRLSANRKNHHLKLLHLMAEQGDWIKLEAVARELLLHKPPSHEMLELAAYRLQQGGCLDATAAIATEATNLFPESWIFHFLAGVALKRLGQNQMALKYLRQAANICPDDQQTIRQLIESVAASEGVDIAASECAAHSRAVGNPKNIVIAPISTVRDWAKKINARLLEVGEIEEIPFKTPCVWGAPSSDNTVFALSNKPYVAEINDARIFSNSSLIFTSDGTILSDTVGHPDFGHVVDLAYEAIVLAWDSDRALLNFNKLNIREIEAGIFLSGLASSAFGHWFSEFLPKLEFLQQHPDFADLPIIVDASMPRSHFEHLSRLAKNSLVLLNANESLLCRRLLVAPSPTFFPVETFPNNIPMYQLQGLSPRALRFLRAGDSYQIKNSRHRRLFLARKNMKWRRLLNEEEIAADLLTLVFEVIFIEKMSMREQIALFQEAQCIVAPNGSALLNLIFADTSTKLIVLTQPNLHNWGTFQGPMDALGYQSLCVCGDYALAEAQKHSDYHIPLQRIRDALLYFGVN